MVWRSCTRSCWTRRPGSSARRCGSVAAAAPPPHHQSATPYAPHSNNRPPMTRSWTSAVTSVLLDTCLSTDLLLCCTFHRGHSNVPQADVMLSVVFVCVCARSSRRLQNGARRRCFSASSERTARGSPQRWCSGPAGQGALRSSATTPGRALSKHHLLMQCSHQPAASCRLVSLSVPT